MATLPRLSMQKLRSDGSSRERKNLIGFTHNYGPVLANQNARQNRTLRTQ
jgi:hypothetical protein